MPLRTALRLCPQAVLVPVDFRAYRDASKTVFGIARDYTPVIEPLSLDEAFLEVSGSVRRFGSPEHIAAEIRDRILAASGLHASFGVATCKTVAKIASDLRKPRGFVVVAPGDEAAFLAPLPLRRLPGLGPASERALSGLGISTLGQLAALPLDTIQRRVGRASGTSLWERSRGIDTAPVTRPGRSTKRLTGRDFRPRRRPAGRAPRTHLRARERCGGAPPHRRVDGTHRDTQAPLLGLHHDHPPGDAGVVDRDRHHRSRRGCRTPRRRLVGRRRAPARGGRHRPRRGSTAGSVRPTANDRIDHTLDSLRERFGQSAIRRGTGEGLHDLDWRGDDLRR